MNEGIETDKIFFLKKNLFKIVERKYKRKLLT